jgi:hypothetical protein
MMGVSLSETFCFKVTVDNARLRLSLVCVGGILSKSPTRTNNNFEAPPACNTIREINLEKIFSFPPSTKPGHDGYRENMVV